MVFTVYFYVIILIKVICSSLKLDQSKKFTVNDDFCVFFLYQSKQDHSPAVLIPFNYHTHSLLQLLTLSENLTLSKMFGYMWNINDLCAGLDLALGVYSL